MSKQELTRNNRGRFVSGRILSLTERKHGKTTYWRHKCRCDICKAAMAAFYRKQYHLRRSQQPNGWRHRSEAEKLAEQRRRATTPEEARNRLQSLKYLHRHGITLAFTKEHPEWQEAIEQLRQVRQQLYRPNPARRKYQRLRDEASLQLVGASTPARTSRR